jgi:hypothetical protein
MMLPVHITIALLSLIYTAYVYFSPSRAKLRGAYVFVALVVTTGTWLIIANPAHMVQSCITGLLYLGVIFYGIHLTSNKLAVQRQEQESDKR